MRRKFRTFLKKRNKLNRVLFWVPVGCAVILLLLYSQDKAAFAAAWRSPLALLSDRSPGSRDAGALYNTKPGYRSKPGNQPGQGFGIPQERVLAVTRERGFPLDDILFPEGLPLDLLGGSAPLSDGLGLPGLGVPGTSGAPGFSGGGLPGLAGLPGGGTPQPAGPETPDTPLPDVVPPLITTPPDCCGGETALAPVPEPSTWAMMIFGFGAISYAMRKSRRTARRPALPGDA